MCESPCLCVHGTCDHHRAVTAQMLWYINRAMTVRDHAEQGVRWGGGGFRFLFWDAEVETTSIGTQQSGADPCMAFFLKRSHFSLSVMRVQTGEAMGITLISFSLCALIHSQMFIHPHMTKTKQRPITERKDRPSTGSKMCLFSSTYRTWRQDS